MRISKRPSTRLRLPLSRSSILTDEETGGVDFRKLEKLVRVLCDIKNEGKDIAHWQQQACSEA